MTKLINRFNSDKLAETLNRLKSQIFVTQTNFSHIMRVTLTLVKSLLIYGALAHSSDEPHHTT